MIELVVLLVIACLAMPKEFWTRKIDRHPHDYD